MQTTIFNVLPTRWRQKPAGIDKKRNYVTVTLCIATLQRPSSCYGQGKKGKVFPYSLPSVGPGADPGVQAVSPQVT